MQDTKDTDEIRDLWVAETKLRLRAAMDARGLTQRALDVAVGFSQGTTGALFSKGAMVNWWRLTKIAEALRVTPDELLGIRPFPADVAREAAKRAELQSIEGKFRELAVDMGRLQKGRR